MGEAWMEENFHALGQGVVNAGEGSEAMGVEGWEGGGQGLGAQPLVKS